jgi:nitrate reductase gamma subunit
MGIALLVIFYGSIVFLTIAVLIKVIGYVRTPVHLRWEIYRESSVYEEYEWWTKGKVGFWHKLKPVLLDVLLQKEYFNRNRSFWYMLIVFHIGLYLLIFWHAWLFIAALVINAEAAPIWGIIWGHVATALITIGAVGILIWRLADADMRAYYPRTHFIKWLFIIITLSGGFYSVQFFFEGSSIELVHYVNGQLQFDFINKVNPELLPALHMLFVSTWMIYLPFSHVMHLVFKYYHELRWDHVPNFRGSSLEKRIEKQLEKRASWSDSHIQTGMKWGEIASGMPEDYPESKVTK